MFLGSGQKRATTRTPVFHRLPIGDKGIGKLAGFDPEDKTDEMPVIKTDREGFVETHPKYVAYANYMKRILTDICREEERRHQAKEEAEKKAKVDEAMRQVTEDFNAYDELLKRKVRQESPIRGREDKDGQNVMRPNLQIETKERLERHREHPPIPPKLMKEITAILGSGRLRFKNQTYHIKTHRNWDRPICQRYRKSSKVKPMQELFNKYISYLELERNVSAYTIRNYTTDLYGSKKIKGFFTFLKEKEVSSLGEVDRTVLRGYLSYLVGQGIVKASIARKLSAILSFYRYLLREGILKTSPIERASSPKLDKRLPSFLTAEEINRLLNTPDLSTPQGQRDRALLELLYASGLRISELVRLDLGRVNLDTRELRVWGKGSKERVGLIGRPAAEAITNYINEGRDRLKGRRKTSALFLNRDGGRLTARSIQLMLEHYAKLAGINKRVHPHTLRHTFATHLLDGGADLRVVQELLGHARLSSTQIYTHVTKSQARKVYLSAHPMARETANESKDS